MIEKTGENRSAPVFHDMQAAQLPANDMVLGAHGGRRQIYIIQMPNGRRGMDQVSRHRGWPAAWLGIRRLFTV